jgi:hypothetical protein
VLQFLGEPFDDDRNPYDLYKQLPCSKTKNCPFVTTIHVLNSAILKLSRLQPALKVFRGTKGILPEDFFFV